MIQIYSLRFFFIVLLCPGNSITFLYAFGNYQERSRDNFATIRQPRFDFNVVIIAYTGFHLNHFCNAIFIYKDNDLVLLLFVLLSVII